MKATGVVRKLDVAGRLVLPKSIRESLGLKDNVDALEIFVDDDKVILKKYSPACSFCGSVDGVVEYKDQKVCASCIKKLASLV